MSAIDRKFAELKANRQKAFMPFITAGDPDLLFTVELIRELAKRGCQLCEVGFPYSDPIADGPVIQASYTRALEHRIKVASIFEALSQVSELSSMPRVAMASYAILYRHDRERFVSEAQQAGVAGVIVPDLPVEEARDMSEICRRADFSLIQLVTPTTPRDRALRIAEATSGFLYYVSVTGITGERSELPAQLIDEVSWLREHISLPLCIGFGISRPEHVERLAQVADGLIVGSAIVRRVAETGVKPRAQVIREIGEYVAELLAATRAASLSQ